MEKSLITQIVESPTVKQMEVSCPDKFRDSMTILITQVFQIAGKNIADVDGDFLIDITIQELKDKYRFMTGKEIRHAFSEGVRGRYGEYYSLTLPTFIKWLEAYLSSDDREKVVDAKRKYIAPTYQLAQENPVSENDQAGSIRLVVESCYENYLETGKIAISNVNSLARVLMGIWEEQMRKDKVLRKGEDLEAVFKRYRENAEKNIY